MSRRAVFCAVISAVVLHSTAIHAQPAEPPARPATSKPPAPRRVGFYFTTSLGLAYAHAVGHDIAGGSTTIGGISAALDLGLGLIIKEFLALSAHLSGLGSLTPLGVWGGVARLGITGTYYILPQNIFVTGSFRFPCLGALSEFVGFGVGLGGEVGAGKEWRLSDTWNVGVKGYLAYDGMIGLALGFLPTAEMHVISFGVSAVFTYFRKKSPR